MKILTYLGHKLWKNNSKHLFHEINKNICPFSHTSYIYMFHCYYCTDTHEKVCVFKLILNMKAQNYASSKHFLLLKLNMYHEIISYIHTHVYMHKISCYYLTHTHTHQTITTKEKTR